MPIALRRARGPAALVLAAGCLSMGLQPTRVGGDVAQPVIVARSRPVLTTDGRQFKDANGNGVVDGYEDWRLPVRARVDDLVTRMTLEEKAGLMLIDTIAPG